MKPCALLLSKPHLKAALSVCPKRMSDHIMCVTTLSWMYTALLLQSHTNAAADVAPFMPLNNQPTYCLHFAAS